jgi:hypothetical protein
VKRDWLFVGCEEGHDMHHIGGCNAGCGPDCSCSVPVFECSRCKDCDYGRNEEAEFIRRKCLEGRAGIEPAHGGFADRSVPTSPPPRIIGGP